MKKAEIHIDDQHLYDITTSTVGEDTTYKMYYSTDSAWTYPGKLVLEVMDYGDGLRFKKQRAKDIDYGEAQELRILLAYIENQDTYPSKVEVCKKEKTLL